MKALTRPILELSIVVLWGTQAVAQTCCPTTVLMPRDIGPTYRTVYQTVYEPREVTSYRIEYESFDCWDRPPTW